MITSARITRHPLKIKLKKNKIVTNLLKTQINKPINANNGEIVSIRHQKIISDYQSRYHDGNAK